jgi:stage V sporulation protein K
MNTDPNKYYQEEQDNLRNWQNYLSETHERNNQMWNTILYNQFVNEEVRNLNRKVYYLKKDLKLERDRIEDLARENNSLIKDLKKYKPVERKRKRSELSKWITNEKRKKPRNYVNLKSDEINNKLKRIFGNLNSIDDIINFEEDPERFDLLKNTKYEKLYKLIPSCKELKKIIGMENVKDNVFKQLSYFLHGLNSSEEINHVVITGEPGVGKTTLAKIIAKIYLAMGFLKNEKFLEAKRSDLIGEYCGHTAVKTQKVINSIDGGVLFIDEVYSLGNREKRDVFTKECIDTINQNLTEKSDKFLCIIAGYKEEVQTCFFDYNKGLERRFPVRFNLESYDENSLREILIKFMKEDDWKLDSDNKNINNELLDLIKKNKEILKFQAGDIKTIFQLTKEKYSLRLLKESINDGAGKKILKIEDFNYSFEKFKELRNNKKEIPEFVKNLYI